MENTEHEAIIPDSPLVQPEISVVVSTYNRHREEGSCKSLLHRAISSILNQTFTNFELIIIDDCSTDGTKTYLLEAASKDSRIHLYCFKKNSGLPALRYNFGMSISRGKYYTFMFDDDELRPNALESLHQAIESLGISYAMVYGLASYHIPNGCQSIVGSRWGWGKIDQYNFIGNNAAIVRREAIEAVGGYDEDPSLLRACDWDLWWRIGRCFRVGQINCNIAAIYAGLRDSIGNKEYLNWNKYRKRQQSNRILPLQNKKKLSLRCRVHSFLFDFYIALFSRNIRRVYLSMLYVKRLKK